MKNTILKSAPINKFFSGKVLNIISGKTALYL